MTGWDAASLAATALATSPAPTGSPHDAAPLTPGDLGDRPPAPREARRADRPVQGQSALGARRGTGSAGRAGRGVEVQHHRPIFLVSRCGDSARRAGRQASVARRTTGNIDDDVAQRSDG